MSPLLMALIVSYLITWFSGFYIARQTRLERAKARRLHFGLSLIT